MGCSLKYLSWNIPRASTQARRSSNVSLVVKVNSVIWIEFTPNEEGKEIRIRKRNRRWCGSREFIPAVEKGLVESMANGVLAGYPMVDD